ncbi:hypothetical protein SAMN04488601_11815 [Paenibacillus sp. 453mf]|nr:hypothetical protein SAMN04488601_11815 [Paenibacillus sp. 453mf]
MTFIMYDIHETPKEVYMSILDSAIKSIYNSTNQLNIKKSIEYNN